VKNSEANTAKQENQQSVEVSGELRLEMRQE